MKPPYTLESIGLTAENEDLAPRVKKYYTREWEVFLTYLNENNLQLTFSSVLKFKNLLKKKYKISTINTKIKVLNRLLTFCGENVTKLIKEKSIPRATLSENDVSLILEYCTAFKTKKYDKLKIAFSILAYTGVRRSELKFFTFNDIKKGYVTFFSKGRERTIIIPDFLKGRILTFVEIYKIKHNCVLLTSRDKNPITENYWYKNLKVIGKELGIDDEKLNVHALRRFYARQFLKNGGDIVALQTLLGHSDIKTTAKYAFCNFTDRIEIVNKVIKEVN